MMDSAQDKLTGTIVEAEQLWQIENVDHERYICRGCGIKVTPASYKPTNKPRPYFSAKNGHYQDCDVEGEEKLVKRGQTERLTHPLNGFPASYPSRLVLLDEREIVDPGASSTSGTKSVVQSTHGSTGASSSHSRRRSANTIRPISRAFINLPYDRDLPLEIPGVNGTNFISVFKRLRSNTLQRYPDIHIFYAPIRWSKPVETDAFLEVWLDAGERESNGRLIPEKAHRLRINWHDWSEFKRRSVRIEMDVGKQEAIEASKKNSNVKGWVFFLGKQDPEDITLFHVSDHRLVCCLHGEIIYPELI
ncbi:hypothetical protein [Paludibacterium purpuratum]|uniref:Uncharacterized protein n=1 Tax=Paludibacterium purpuratum TaxID=1144873 RepID=A0A4R7B938_9NEIS|nr:hypothetical protein [Paludibacterium purpuratum]TDR80107.1 hypothetical protein DFP86_106250 [Paludibacterium purpuratum]